MEWGADGGPLLLLPEREVARRVVANYQITMESTDLVWFRNHMGTDRCFPAQLTVDGQNWSCWIGYRGRFSRRFAKPSFDIWFDRKQPFFGQTQRHLTSAYRDPSLLRGRLAHELFSDLDVPTPSADHVWLSFNDDAIGLYTAYEALDSRWLERHQLPDGAIYYGVGGEGNLGLINPKNGKRKRNLDAGFEKCHPQDESTADLEELILAIVLPDDPVFADSIAQVVDVECCLRWLVGIMYMSHTDGLAHNFALLRPGGKRWQISPWDCDGTFGRGPDGSRVPAEYLPVHGGGQNYLITRLLHTPRWRARYRELWTDLLPTTLNPERVLGRMEVLCAEIGPQVVQDGNKGYSDTMFQKEPAYVGRWLQKRVAFIQRQVAQVQDNSAGSPAT